MKVAIINCGIGNLHSVEKALSSFGVKTVIVSNYSQLKGVDKIVIPGVGAFGEAIRNLEEKKLLEALKEQANKKPLLGICLGMQLLFERSQESEGIEGLGFLKGEVLRFKKKSGIKVPHMGWNQVKFKRNSKIFKDITEGAHFYFCHSYYVVPKDKKNILATSDYGGEFVCAIQKDNLYGVQFHPEKSQKIGLKLLENFLKEC